MFSLLNSKRLDHGVYLILEFRVTNINLLFSMSFYAKTISSDPNVGTSLWGFACLQQAYYVFCYYLSFL